MNLFKNTDTFLLGLKRLFPKEYNDNLKYILPAWKKYNNWIINEIHKQVKDEFNSNVPEINKDVIYDWIRSVIKSKFSIITRIKDDNFKVDLYFELENKSLDETVSYHKKSIEIENVINTNLAPAFWKITDFDFEKIKSKLDIYCQFKVRKHHQYYTGVSFDDFDYYYWKFNLKEHIYNYIVEQIKSYIHYHWKKLQDFYYLEKIKK